MNTDQMRDVRQLTKRPNNTNHKILMSSQLMALVIIDGSIILQATYISTK